MYITTNDIKGEKTIDLPYPIHSRKEALGPHYAEIAVIRMLCDNIQYEVVKPHTIFGDISGDKN